MTREEAIKILIETHDNALFSVRTALETLIPELVDSKDEIIRKELLALVRMNVLPEATCLVRGGSVTRAQAESWLEKQKESGIKWLKSDNVKNPDKPYIDKAGMFYTTDGRMCHASDIEKQQEQKPILSDRDLTDFEIEVHEIIAQARNDSRLNDADVLKQFEEEAAFALMLKANKLIEQKPAEWSENESNLLDSIIEDYEKANRSFCGYDGKIGLLKAIRSGEYNLPKQEWSEEDEKMLNLAIEWTEIMSDKFSFADMDPTDFDKINAWLKSLRPQSHWRPSEEQMTALHTAVYLKEMQFYGGLKDKLRNLYEQLKILM